MTIKQMGVIYRAFKEGKLQKTTAEDIDKAYFFVKKLGTGREDELRRSYRDTYEAVLGLKAAVDAIFAGDYEEADRIVWAFGGVSYC